MRELYGMFMKMEKEDNPEGTQEDTVQEDETLIRTFDLTDAA
jgi:hypothetical protein